LKSQRFAINVAKTYIQAEMAGLKVAH
jgi:hypothetical protein